MKNLTEENKIIDLLQLSSEQEVFISIQHLLLIIPYNAAQRVLYPLYLINFQINLGKYI